MTLAIGLTLGALCLALAGAYVVLAWRVWRSQPAVNLYSKSFPRGYPPELTTLNVRMLDERDHNGEYLYAVEYNELNRARTGFTGRWVRVYDTHPGHGGCVESFTYDCACAFADAVGMELTKEAT